MTHIVFLDRDTIPAHIQFKDPAFAHTWVNYPTTDHTQLIERALPAEIIITNKVALNDAALAQLPNLKHIAVIATGFNIIDIDSCKKRGISVSNTPDYSVTSVPEHTMAMLLGLRRHLFAYRERVCHQQWQQSPYFHDYYAPTLDLKGARMGIIGGGSLGQATAKVAKALGMDVVFAQRKSTTSVTPKKDYFAFDEVIRSSDVISLHCPLTDETRDLISYDELKAMKSSAILINTARGGIVNETALRDALKQQWIAAAGLDVTSAEPITDDNPLLEIIDYPNLLITPHIAWSSESALHCQADMVIDNIDHFVAGKPYHRVV